MTVKDNQVDSAELERLGIVRVMTESFAWGGYRYGSARDAIAAATRSEKK